MFGVFVSWMNVTANQLRMSGGGAPSFENTKSIIFDGADDYIDMGLFSINATNGLTLSCWLKDASDGFLCSNGSGGGVNSQFNLKFNVAGQLFSSFVGSSSYTGLGGFNDGNWHHLAMTINYSNGDVKFFKDSVVSATVLTFGSSYSSGNFKIIGSAGSWGNISGTIDEFAIFDSTFDASAVAAIYNSGVPDDLASLSPISWWRMGDGDTYDIITDHGSGGNDGTMTNMSAGSIVSDVP